MPHWPSGVRRSFVRRSDTVGGFSEMKDLHEVVLDALELHGASPPSPVHLPPARRRLVVGSGNALPTARVVFSDEPVVFSDEGQYGRVLEVEKGVDSAVVVSASGTKHGSPDIKVGRSPGRSDQELCDLGRNRLIHGFFWDLPEQYFLASVDGRLRRPRSGWGACSAAAKSRRKVFNLWLLLDDRWAGDTAQVVPVR